MSTTIDQKIVEMRFDNRQFESNVATSMSTVEKLKQSLNLTGATKGLENVGAAAKNVNIISLGNAAETVGLKFRAMYSMADQYLRNLTTRVQNTAERMISALTIDPIKTGFSEYETQINAVQTILANTESKGTDINDVNQALDTLNKYADKTIYNFTEMTRNIGTFTAAGVDLDTSVKSIQGIANLAAVSGSTSQQASTAMYQLSQALAAGKVSLMDWNSVVNAGMGGEVFQNALKRTAKSMGTDVDAIIKKYGSFRESLTQGEWLTTDVLTKTLEQFTMAAEEGSEEWKAFKKELMAEGYTSQQAEEILKMANTATDAATKVKTFTQLWDTLKEAAQSGWTQTWEIIVGDFEEAKELLTNVSNVIGDMINKSAEARNNLLQGWKDAGGRADLVDALANAFDGLMSVVKPIKEAFAEIFPPLTVDHLVNFTKGLKELTAKFTLSDTASENLKRTFKGLFAVVNIVRQVFVSAFKAIAPLFGGVDDLGGGILSVTAKIGDWLVSLNDAIESSGIFTAAVDKIHKAIKVLSEFLQPVVDGIKNFCSSVSNDLDAVATNTEGRFQPLVALGKFITGIFVGIGNVLKKVFPYISAAASGIGNVLKSLMDRISDSMQNLDFNGVFDVINGGVITAIGVFIAKFIKAGSDIVDGAGGFMQNLKDILEGAGDALGAFTSSLKADALKKIAVAIAILAGALLVLSLIDSEKLGLSLVAISTLFGELMLTMSVFSKTLNGLKLKGLTSITSSILTLAAALLVLSIALKIMSTMSWSEMGVGLISLTVGLGVLVAAVNLLPESKVSGAAKAIKKMSTALLILAIAIKIMSTMSWKEMGVGLISMVVGLGALVAAVNLLPKDTALRAAGLVGLATAMVILSGALKIMATMSWTDIAKSLVALGGSLAILAGAMAIMKSAIPGALAMLIVAPALVVLAGAMKILSTMSWSEVAKGLVALGGSLLIIAGAMYLMTGALPGAAALLVVAAALAVLTPILLTLGSMSLAEIGKSLLVLAGVFAVFGLAGLILQPLVPTLLALAGALALLGVACAAIGAGVLMVGVGFSALAAALATGGVAIVTFVTSLISLIPFIIEQIGEGLIRLCKVIAGSSAAICEALTVIILALVDALVASVPAIVEGAFVLIDELLKALVKYTPTIVMALFDLLIGVLDGISAKLPDLIQAGVNVVMALLSGVIDALKTIDPNILVGGILAVGFMTALMIALAGIASLTPLAMVGVLGLGAVVTELSLVLAAIGALAQIPGLEWLISEGGDFLQTIGNAIGQFVGGIVGGIAEGFTSSLPQVGTDLSTFMTNLKPFLDGVATIDESTMFGAKALVDTILALTGANLIESLTSWLTGGSSLADFGAELAAFGPCLKQYSDAVSGVDNEAILASSQAAKNLADMAAALPNEGGLVSLFTGDNSIASFGEQLVTFGASLKDYSLAVAGVDSEAVGASADAASKLSEMAASLPNIGGMVSWFTGDNDLATFGTQLKQFGVAMKGYSASVAGIDAEAIGVSVVAAQKLASLESSICNSGGMVSWFTGDNDLGTFGANLVDFGTAMKTYSDKVAGIDAAAMGAATYQFQQLVRLANSAADTEFGGLTNFAISMGQFGYSTVDNFIAAFEDAYTRASDAAHKLVEGMLKGVKTLQADFTTEGEKLIDNLSEGVSNSERTFKQAATTMLTNAVSAMREKYQMFYDAGSYLVSGFANGISANTYKAAARARAMAAAAVSAAKRELDEHSPSKVGYGIGDFFGIAFVNAIGDHAKNAYKASSEMASSAKTGLSDAISKINDFVNSDIDSQPTIRPVLDMSNVRAEASNIGNLFSTNPSVGVLANVGSISAMMNHNQNGTNDDVVSAIKDLGDKLDSLPANTTNVNGITYDDGSNISNTVKALVRAAKIERRS